MLLKDTCEMAARILAGEFNGDLDYIIKAAEYQKKVVNAASGMRKGAKVRIVKGGGGRLPNGSEGEVLKVNAKTISIGVGVKTTDQWGTSFDGGEWRVSPGMLQVI